MWINRGFVATCGRLEITGSLPADLRDRSILLAANHIGVFDAFVLTAACDDRATCGWIAARAR
jgi:1-acyl-sn-glycerol-3-phosphate acyltransferase